jgi:hypothetical protein
VWNQGDLHAEFRLTLDNTRNHRRFVDAFRNGMIRGVESD